jgi:hypothetical protein
MFFCVQYVEPLRKLRTTGIQVIAPLVRNRSSFQARLNEANAAVLIVQKKTPIQSMNRPRPGIACSRSSITVPSASPFTGVDFFKKSDEQDLKQYSQAESILAQTGIMKEFVVLCQPISRTFFHIRICFVGMIAWRPR